MEVQILGDECAGRAMRESRRNARVAEREGDWARNGWGAGDGRGAGDEMGAELLGLAEKGEKEESGSGASKWASKGGGWVEDEVL